MNRRRDRLDEYVRQAMRLDDRRTATLGESEARRALLEEISRMPIAQPSPSSAPPRKHLRMVTVVAAAAVVTASVVVLTGLLGRHDRPPSAQPGPTQSSTQAGPTEGHGDLFPGHSLECVERYGAQTIANRAFAFDGTVVSIGDWPAGGGQADPYVAVVLRVNHWYRGGRGDTVTVAMFPPEVVTSVGNAAYGVGSRLLVSGEARYGGAPLDDPVSWACGFTRWYSEADAQAWRQAFR